MNTNPSITQAGFPTQSLISCIRWKRCRQPLVVKASSRDRKKPQPKAATLAKLVQFGVQLKKAIDSEDYVSARKLQHAIVEIDPATKLAWTAEQVKQQLRECVTKERYEEAAQLRDRLTEVLGAQFELEEALYPPCKLAVPLPPHLRSRWYYQKGQQHICYPPTSSEQSTASILASLSSAPVQEAAGSQPGLSDHTFECTVTITNQSASPVKLLRTCWHVTDGLRGLRTVRHEGVGDGQQVVLLPGQCFEYKESCRLGTPLGSMEGYFEAAPCQAPTSAGDSHTAGAGAPGKWVPEDAAGGGQGSGLQAPFKVFVGRVALRSSGAAAPGAQSGSSG